MAELIVAGSVNTDLVITSDRLPTPGETVLGGQFSIFAGGKGANQAVAAARMGQTVHFIGAVGNDDFGAARLNDLKRDGIDTGHVKIVDDEASGVALILIGENADNMIAVSPGANHRMTTADIDRAFDALPDINVVLVQLEIPLPVVEHIAARCVRDNRTLILNPAPCPSGGLPDGLPASAAIVTPNQTEFELLGGPPLTDPDDPGQQRAAARFVSERGWKTTIVTLSAAGAMVIHCDRDIYRIPAPQVDAVDTVGAGDCLNGVLAAELANGASVRNAVTVAIHAASIAVTRPGAQAGMPYKTDISD